LLGDTLVGDIVVVVLREYRSLVIRALGLGHRRVAVE
jgi:hypothetical protein